MTRMDDADDRLGVGGWDLDLGVTGLQTGGLWRARGQGRAPVSKAHSRTLVGLCRAVVGVAVVVRLVCCVVRCSCWLCGVEGTLTAAPESGGLAGTFSLPTFTSSARGAVQFWLTRRPTPAAIYGHRHPGGVSGLALSSLFLLSSPAAVSLVQSNPTILGVRAQQRRSGSTFTTHPTITQKIPAFRFT
jgi:hypothetical protein